MYLVFIMCFIYELGSGSYRGLKLRGFGFDFRFFCAVLGNYVNLLSLRDLSLFL